MVAVIPSEAPTIGDPLVSMFILGDPVTQGSFDPSRNPLRYAAKAAIGALQRGNVAQAIAILNKGLAQKSSGFHHAKADELAWWRDRIEKAVRRHRGPNAPTIETPVLTTLLFVVARKGPAAKAAYRIWPMGQEGDVDKLARAAHDGLGRNHRQEKIGDQVVKYTVGAEVFADDRKVMGCVAMKTYALPGEDPGVYVRIWAPDPALERAGWSPVPDWPSWRYVHRDQLPPV
jgi:hypothetical protein